MCVVKGDYGSPAFLGTAFKGIDAVVITAGTGAIGEQGVVVEAAARAGVRRIVPSEFGSVSFCSCFFLLGSLLVVMWIGGGVREERR